MKFACYTLGCKVNQYETQAMAQLLVQSGHTLGSFAAEFCAMAMPPHTRSINANVFKRPEERTLLAVFFK